MKLKESIIIFAIVNIHLHSAYLVKLPLSVTTQFATLTYNQNLIVKKLKYTKNTLDN